MIAVFSFLLTQVHTFKVYDINMNPTVMSARLDSCFKSLNEVNAACTCSVFCTALCERASVHTKL